MVSVRVSLQRVGMVSVKFMKTIILATRTTTKSQSTVMKGVVVLAVFVAVLSTVFLKTNYTNNVCKTFEDYHTDRDSNENCYYNPDGLLQVPEIIQRHGYPVEIHNATTKDGYILKLFRIPHGRKSSSNKNRQPVLLQHGAFLNGGSFVVIGNKSLGFILADAGYDVWLGNLRGSAYSRKHLELNDTDSRFWDFSIDEQGAYDVAAQLDVIHNINEQKIIYIGYSLGSVTGYIYSITYPEAAQEKLRVLISLAPAAFMTGWKSVTRYAFWMWNYGEPIIQTLTNGEAFGPNTAVRLIKRFLCVPFPFLMKMCHVMDMAVWGFSFDQIDYETLPVTFLQNGDSTSVRTVTHLTQLVERGNFEQFHYGIRGNIKVYGTAEPPRYDMSKVRVPSYLIRAENDWMISKEDVEKLYTGLPKETTPYNVYTVKDEKFNHGDFMIARDVVPLVYDHVLTFMRNL